MSGILAALSGDVAATDRVTRYVAPAHGGAIRHASSKYRFCTNFAVTGSDLSAEHFRNGLERLGDSVLVVGDDTTLRIHVHTNDPNEAMALFQEFGEVIDVELEDMVEMTAARADRLAAGVGDVDRVRCRGVRRGKMQPVDDEVLAEALDGGGVEGVGDDQEAGPRRLAGEIRGSARSEPLV